MDVINTQIFEKIQASDSLIPNTLFICLYNFIHAGHFHIISCIPTQLLPSFKTQFKFCFHIS